MRQTTLAVPVAVALSFLVIALPSTSAIVCTPETCQTVRCANVSPADCEKNGQKFQKNGGFCGCCHACVTVLKEGQNCFVTNGTPPRSVCEEGTICRNSVCVRPN